MKTENQNLETKKQADVQTSALSDWLASGRKLLLDGGCSRWTNANRSMAIHIKFDDKFLCGRKYFTTLGIDEPFDFANVTCDKCKIIYKRLSPSG